MSQRLAGLFWAVIALALISSYVYFRLLDRSAGNAIIDSAFKAYPGWSSLALVILGVISVVLSWKQLNDPKAPGVSKVTAGLRLTIYAGFALLLVAFAWNTLLHVL